MEAQKSVNKNQQYYFCGCYYLFTKLLVEKSLHSLFVIVVVIIVIGIVFQIACLKMETGIINFQLTVSKFSLQCCN